MESLYKERLIMNRIFIFLFHSFAIWGCKSKLPNIKINPIVAKDVAIHIDTLHSSEEFFLADKEMLDIFNSELFISYNNSPFYEAFANGNTSINDDVLKICYRLSESAGTYFEVQVNLKKREIKNAAFQMVGDDSPSSNRVKLKINRIKFNRIPNIGESLCFYIDGESTPWKMPGANNQITSFNILGYINKVIRAE